jgi:hypothetical protein
MTLIFPFIKEMGYQNPCIEEWQSYKPIFLPVQLSKCYY